MRQNTYFRRILAALVVSSLLHAAIAVAPYLGLRQSASRPALQGPKKPGQAGLLEATLAHKNETAAKLAKQSTTGANAPTLPTHPKPSEVLQPPAPLSTGVDLLPITAPAYYTTDQLTKRPELSSAPPKLDVPEKGPAFTSGKVILTLWINALGSVTSVDIEESDVPEVVSERAVAAFEKLHFVPGEINGRPVGTMMRIEVTYDEETMTP